MYHLLNQDASPEFHGKKMEGSYLQTSINRSRLRQPERSYAFEDFQVTLGEPYCPNMRFLFSKMELILAITLTQYDMWEDRRIIQ